MAERRADDATRDVVDFLKCEYMEQHVGDVFEGTITAVTGFGLFVSLNDVFVEGLVHISNLNNDFYQFDQVKHRLVGERTRKTFRLGDKLWIQVMGVSLDDRKIDFGLATNPNDDSAVDSGDQPVHKNTPSHKPSKRTVVGDDSATEGGDKKKRRGPRRNNRKKTTNTGVAKKTTEGNNSSETPSKTDSPAKKKKRPKSKRQKLNGAQAKSKSQSADASKTRKPKKPGSAKKKVKKSNAKAHND